MNNYNRFGMVPSLGMLASIVSSELAEDESGISGDGIGIKGGFSVGIKGGSQSGIEGFAGIGEDNSV